MRKFTAHMTYVSHTYHLAYVSLALPSDVESFTYSRQFRSTFFSTNPRRTHEMSAAAPKAPLGSPAPGSGIAYPITIGPFAMKAGKYYVGDLTYVLDTAAWTELHILLDNKEHKYGTCEMGQGRFTLSNGRIVVIYDLPCNGYRRREYEDMTGRVYYNTSGTFGMTLAKGLEEEYHDKGLNTSPEQEGEDWGMTIARLAHIVTYTKKFNCTNAVSNLVDGRIMGGDCEISWIQLGKVCINTDESQEDGVSPTDEDE
ncbi:hypothetical protein T484DRAFT_2296051 [Baffinella frigidus]|nr:hypothetical protein T484DRAFT_2296051 [Cryptophyta sp. CCMP2293]